MTGEIKLTQVNSGGTFVVDLTNNNCAVKRLINNPVFTLALPKTKSVDPNNPADSNQIVVNLSMLTDRFILQFDLTDGVGADSNYRKLIMMSSNTLGNANPITLTYDDRTYGVLIEELSMGTQPGKKDFLEGCSMSLIYKSSLV